MLSTNPSFHGSLIAKGGVKGAVGLGLVSAINSIVHTGSIDPRKVMLSGVIGAGVGSVLGGASAIDKYRNDWKTVSGLRRNTSEVSLMRSTLPAALEAPNYADNPQLKSLVEGWSGMADAKVDQIDADMARDAAKWAGH